MSDRMKTLCNSTLNGKRCDYHGKCIFAHSIDEIIKNRESKNMPFKVFECKNNLDCTFKVCNFAHYDTDNVMRELQYFRDLQGFDQLEEYPCLNGEPDIILRINGTFRPVKPRVPDCPSKQITATDKQKKQMSPESTATSSNEMLGENVQKSPKSDRSNKSRPNWADMISDDESSEIEPIPSLDVDNIAKTEKKPKPSLDVDNIAKTESATLPVRDAWDDPSDDDDDDEPNTQLDYSESKSCQKKDDKKKDNKKKDDKKKDDKKKDDKKKDNHHHVKNDHDDDHKEDVKNDDGNYEKDYEKHSNDNSCEEPPTEEDDSLLTQQQQQQQQYMKMIMIPFESNPQVLQKLTEILRDMAELRREVADLRREINDKKQ